ncbi:MAG TPA: CYTH and CHAD domain-containing protein [Acidimicrobiales bacterium]|nr:CYTH and CHAD domain-containing protein [Acidimicrobiales bacterium]
MSTETEVKMGAWAGFKLPSLAGVVDDVTSVARVPRTLMAVYYDTADLRLARWGVTVRHRSGDGSGTGWTVKLPEGDDGPALVRRELTFEGPPGRMPAGATSLIRAYARDTPLVPVARIRTVRTGVDLVDSEGAVVAEVVDDEVSVLHGGRVATRFREVEVELGARPPAGLLDTVVDLLRRAGAGEPDSTPKVVHALGAPAQAPPEVAPVVLGKKPTAADLVRQAVSAAVDRIMRHDPGVRIGDDPEDVHQARVGTRRLRSDLRTFGDLLDEEWLASLRDELRWLAGALGQVRDDDVLIDRLRRQAATLPEPDTGALAPIFRRLAMERDQARAELLEAFESPRYVALLERLVDAARQPQCRKAADAPAEDAVPALVARPWRKLRKAVDALPADPPDADLHQVRILAKRTRYAAEAAAPLVGKKAKAFASAVAELQEVLGDHQDAVVAEVWLRSAVEGADAAVCLAAGELIAVQMAEAAEGRKRWRKAWKKASAEKLRSWM